MGSYLSRNTAEVEELDISSNTAYRYPPKSGNYFGSHFIMGGSKFETMQPEAYLFGENSDLNFLGPKPYNLPYKVCSPSQPVTALRCLVNIRKDSLRLLKVPSAPSKTTTNEDESAVDHDRQITAEEGEGPFLYNIEFTFDADCPCSITIYYNATEEMYNKNVIYSPDPARDCSDTAHYNTGCNQQFCLPTHRIDPAKFAVSEVDWTKGYTKIPIVIQVCADCGPTVVGHSHITYAEFYKPTETTWSIRAIKQKQAIDGICYLLQEIYGIENKYVSNKTNSEDDQEEDDDMDDDSSECVVCLSETRDTLILPCKHLCLCSTCANQLRYQQSGCPICRQSFRALLQIRAVRKKSRMQETSRTRQTRSLSRDAPDVQSNAEETEDDEAEVVVPVPDGYEVVPLIEAIKGCIVPVTKATQAVSTASTSVDNVELVDETAAVSPEPIGCETVLKEKESDTGSGSEIEELEMPTTRSPTLPTAPPLEENEHTADDSDADDDGETSSHVYCEVPLPGAATNEIGTESGESQNSAKELLPGEDSKVQIVEGEKSQLGRTTVHIYAEI